jgi:hypothetical protein
MRGASYGGEDQREKVMASERNKRLVKEEEEE